VRISLHPAGHVLGSAQVRLQWQGDVWVVSGDYFVSGVAGDTNETCTPFEPVRCDCFVTESTFGLPVYRWEAQATVQAQIREWWQSCASHGQTALLLGYSFGKAQRLLAALGHADEQPGPIWVHPAVHEMCLAYQAAGIRMPGYRVLPKSSQQRGSIDGTDTSSATGHDWSRAIVVAPPALLGSAWAQALPQQQSAFASGWMRLRSGYRRQRMDRGFVLSDHADWPGLTQAIVATGAERVIVMHGYAQIMTRWLQEQGLRAGTFDTEYGDDLLDTAAQAMPAAAGAQEGTQTVCDAAAALPDQPA
jgi:putative mRNA 3-end processing factor